MSLAIGFLLGTMFGGLAGFAIGAILYDGGARIRRPRKITISENSGVRHELACDQEASWN